jgi:hypothetical protein
MKFTLKLSGSFLESVYENVMTIVLQHEVQLLNYLKATTIEVGLLMNFGNEQCLNGSFTINSKSNLFDLRQSVAE